MIRIPPDFMLDVCWGMMTTTFLISADGRTAEPHAVLARAVEGGDAGCEDLTRLVAERGLIAVARSKSIARVWLRPAGLSRGGLLTLTRWLQTFAPERVAIAYFDTDWNFEIAGSGRAAAASVAKLVETARRLAPPPLLSRPAAPLSLAAPMVALLRYWHADHMYSREVFHRLAGANPELRFVAVDVVEDAGSRLVISDISARFTSIDERWRRSAIGMDIEDQPDQRFGAWVGDAMRRMLRAGTPRVEEADTIVWAPSKGTVQTSYRRLLLPFQRPDGAKVVVTTSLLDESIDLRRERTKYRL